MRSRRAGGSTVRALSAVLLGLAAIAACGDDPPETSVSTATTEPTVTTATTGPTVTTATTEPTATTGPTVTSGPTATSEPAATTGVVPVEETRVNVYWAWSIPTSVGTPERLGAGSRSVPVDDQPTSAVAELLDGPNEPEAAVGMGTAIPAGTTVHGVDVDGGVARVDLDDTFTEPSGTLAEATRLAQVVFTLTAFDDVDRVTFSIDGEPQDRILSHGFEVGDGFDRDDFAEVRPFILVEAPTPGEVVDGEVLDVEGESNTFESNVRWELLDGTGAVVDEGFTTATSGMGTWGRFTFTVDLGPLDDGVADGADDGADGPAGVGGAIVVFETSPRDDTRQNVVEVPFVRD